MKPHIDYTLYLVTDRGMHPGVPVADAVRRAVSGGCTVVQLREKDVDSRGFFDVAVEVKRAADAAGVPLIINDRADIALAVDAAGVHVGQSDLPAAAVRKIVGPDRVVGVSASTLDEALQAERDGADYLGVGAMFATGTKSDATVTPMEELRRIRDAVRIPVVAIGGLNLQTVPSLRGTGIQGIAVVSAILAQPDMEKAARELLAAFNANVKG